MPQNNPTLIPSVALEAAVSIQRISGSCGGCRKVREGCGICSEDIVMWHCGEEVEVACDGGVSSERQRFIPNGGVCIENVNVSCCGEHCSSMVSRMKV